MDSHAKTETETETEIYGDSGKAIQLTSRHPLFSAQPPYARKHSPQIMNG